eukprot:1893464-Rhodomonas_salina.2
MMYTPSTRRRLFGTREQAQAIIALRSSMIPTVLGADLRSCRLPSACWCDLAQPEPAGARSSGAPAAGPSTAPCSLQAKV